MASTRLDCEQKMCVLDALCERCADDQRFLRSKERPQIDSNLPVITTADVFAGCGGMSLGLQEGARRAGFRVEVGLAIDSDPQVGEIYRRNFNHKVNVAKAREKLEMARLGFIHINLGTLSAIITTHLGKDTRSLQAFLGHRNIQSTVRYTAMAPNRFKGWERE